MDVVEKMLKYNNFYICALNLLEQTIPFFRPTIFDVLVCGSWSLVRDVTCPSYHFSVQGSVGLG